MTARRVISYYETARGVALATCDDGTVWRGLAIETGGWRWFPVDVSGLATAPLDGCIDIGNHSGVHGSTVGSLPHRQ